MLAYDLVNWKNDCIKNGLGKSETLVDTRTLETWHYGRRKILVGFVAVPKDKAAIAIDAFKKETALEISEDVYNAVQSKSAKKAEFALDMIYNKDPEKITIPQYIAEGLQWLENEILAKDNGDFLSKES